MTIEIAVVIAIASLGFTMYQGIRTMNRAQVIDGQSEATKLTTVIVKLENISNGVVEIKADLSAVKEEFRQYRERLIKVEETYKALQARLDSYESRCKQHRGKQD